MSENKQNGEKPVLTDIRREEHVSLRERRAPKGLAVVKGELEENKSVLMLFLVIVAALAVILISILSLNAAAVPVCMIVVIEAALAVCLHDVPLWLHGLVVIGQIVAGALSGNVIFIVMCAVLYVLCILTLRFIRD